MQLVSTVQVGDRWVTQCAWTLWKASDVQTCKWVLVTRSVFSHPIPAASMLACGMSSGDVILIDVTQKLLVAPTGSPFGLEVAAVIRNEKAATADKRIITAMRWISRKDFTVSGLVHLTLIYRSCQVAYPCLL